MSKGPHIFDNALAELETEVWEGFGLVEIEHGPNRDPAPVMGVSLRGDTGNVLMARFGFLPGGQPYVRFTGMNAMTGDQIAVHALETETGAFIETD